MSEIEHPLGMRPPKDKKHVERWPLLATAEEPLPVRMPVVFGINWYQAFDRPKEIQIRGRSHPIYMIGTETDWGKVRGGHAICAADVRFWHDPLDWQAFYDQRPYGGACTGFSAARFKTQLDRVRYDAPQLYRRAQEVDEFKQTPPEEGSSVRAAFDVMRTEGLVQVYRGKSGPVKLENGISANRWLTTTDDILTVLGTANWMGGVVPFLQSWGLQADGGYPHIVYMPAEGINRLMAEGGECTTATDR